MTPRAFPIDVGPLILGEGPVWDPINMRVSVVDIFGQARHLIPMSDGSLGMGTVSNVPSDLGAALPLRDGSWLSCERAGIFAVSETGNRQLISRLPLPAQTYRCNDAKLGPDGKLWVGVMHDDALKGASSLWSISRDGASIPLLEGLTIPNGMDWWLDEFWFVDGPAPEIRSFVLLENRLRPTGRKIELPGTPDGLTIDALGRIWVAIWGQGLVLSFDQTGVLLARIEVPSPNTTSVCFAGPNLDVLVITTATYGLDESELLKYPLAGGVFSVRGAGPGRLPFMNFS